ncbi:MAG: hypothetical protein KFB93_00430 [Simkaniaceae bacterium]|jgi:hypothetical protein|nr:MAG: hypothetical protein KFB93_00430 [Simkaniaceae bacterium]
MYFKFLCVFFIVLCQPVFANSLSEKDIYALFLGTDLVKNEEEIEKTLKKSLNHSGLEFQKEGLFLSYEGCKDKKGATLVKLKFLSSEDQEDNNEERFYGVIKGKSYRDNIYEKSLFFIVEQERMFSVDFEGSSEEFYGKLENLLEKQVIEIQRNSFGKETPLLFLTVANRPIE